MNLFGVELGAKRLGLLHEVIPAASVIGLLTNPNYLTAETEAREIEEAARLIGRTILVLKASNENEIDSAFDGLKARSGALIVGTDPFFNSSRERIIALAAREACWRKRTPHPTKHHAARTPRTPTNHLDDEALSLLVGPTNEPKSWLEVEFATARVRPLGGR